MTNEHDDTDIEVPDGHGNTIVVPIADIVSREQLAQRVADATQGPRLFDIDPEQFVRAKHAAAVEELAQARAARDAMNRTIAALVDQETVMQRLVHVFDRWNERQEADNDDGT